jgi:hypothetical protein
MDRGRSDAPSTLGISTLFDMELTDKLEIKADAALLDRRTHKREKLLQLGFDEVVEKEKQMQMM